MHRFQNEVSCGCRIDRLHLCKGGRPFPPMSDLDMTLKKSDGEASVLEL